MQYLFSARCKPDGVYVRLDVKNPPLKLRVGDVEGQTCELTLLLSGGVHLAVSVTTKAVIADIATFHNQINTVCKSIYDAATFLGATSVGVELTSLTEVETGRFWTFQDAVPELAQSVEERPLSTEAFINLALSNPYLRSALSDLNEAIRSPNDTGFYCYRAIETLMQEFKQQGEDNKAAWPRFRDALRVSKEWIKPLTDTSIGNRHGELKSLSGQERVFLMTRAWTLVYRFVRLKSLNIAQLPVSEFRLLDHGAPDTGKHPVEGGAQ
jgi:hypothetical protein